MARRKYRHVWDDLAFIDTDFINGWGAFAGYDGPLEFDGLTPSKAHAVHDAERDQFRVAYAAKADCGEGLPVICTIQLERRAANYGGKRVYFRAPCCGKRVRKLALLPGRVACGSCGSITHRSRRRSGVQRLIYRADMLAGRLGCETWYSSPKERPTGMRRDKFNRLCDEHAAYVQQALVKIQPRLARAARRGTAARMGAALRAGL